MRLVRRLLAGWSMSLSAVEVHLKKGDILYRQGDANDSAFIVASGEILLYQLVNGERVDRERRRAGCILGETSILTGDTRVVTVVAVKDTLLYKIAADDILSQFRDLNPIMRACVGTAIDFITRYNGQTSIPEEGVRVVESNLSNARELIERFQFEQDMRNGLEQGQFHMAYQPIVRLQTGVIEGFEALMRWQHHTYGNVPPDHFIDMAEKMGTVGRLTEFALIETTRALRDLCLATKRPLFASVNISGQDVDRAGFVDLLEHAIDIHGVSPEQIKLEVTETALVPDSDQAARNLAHLRRLGCGIAIDDFGTGYSNLGYLKSLPLTAIKIDRCFAGDAAHNQVSRSIVGLLVGLGRELEVDVIAEGLETEADVKALTEIGCQFAQGYFFHPPMPLASLSEILAGNKSGQQNVA